MDALDESENGTLSEPSRGRTSREENLHLFSELCKRSRAGKTIVKIIVVSRPANEIEKRLRAFPRINLEEENRPDIQRIVNAGVRSMLQLISEFETEDVERRSRSRPWLSTVQQEHGRAPHVGDINSKFYAEKELDFVKKYLVEAAEGVILWVVLVIDELYHHIRRGFWTLKEIRAKLFSLPKDLEATYSEIINMLKSHSRDEVTRSRLMLMLASFRKELQLQKSFETPWQPLPALICRRFLHENRFGNFGMLRRAIVQRCGGLLEIIRPSSKESVTRSFSTSHVEMTDTVQLIHQTVKDFLLFDTRTASFHLDKSECQYWIDDACFTYLVLSVSVNNLQNKPVFSWNADDYDLFVHHLNDRSLLCYIFSFCP